MVCSHIQGCVRFPINGNHIDTEITEMSEVSRHYTAVRKIRSVYVESEAENQETNHSTTAFVLQSDIRARRTEGLVDICV